MYVHKECLDTLLSYPYSLENLVVTQLDINPSNFLAQKRLSTYYVCCIYSNALQANLITEANTINLDQTVS